MNNYWTDNSNMKANRHWQGMGSAQREIPLDDVTGFLLTNGFLYYLTEIHGVYDYVLSATSASGFSTYIKFYDLDTQKILLRPTWTVTNLPRMNINQNAYKANLIYGYGYTDELSSIYRLKQEDFEYISIQTDAKNNQYTIPFLVSVRNYKIDNIAKTYSDIISYTFKQGLSELYDNVCIIQIKTTTETNLTGYSFSNFSSYYPIVNITFNR